MLSAVESFLVSKVAKMRSCWSTLRLEDRSALCRDVPRVSSVCVSEGVSRSFPSVSKNPASVGHPKLQTLAYYLFVF